MYCSNCGKPVEEDANFCKYCGAKIGEQSKQKSSPYTKSLYKRYITLPYKWQVTILCYILWVLGWICAVIITGIECCDSDFEYALLWAFISVFIIPFASFAFYHIKRIQKEKKALKEANCADNRELTKENMPSKTKPQSAPKNIAGKEVERFTLQEFSLLYGKMQVKVVKLGEGAIESYCAFTNEGKETKVDFGSELGNLTAAEISARKLELCIVEYEGKHYVLSNK